MYFTNAAPCMPLKSTRLECRHFYNFFLQSYTKETTKITNHKALLRILMIDKYFHIHTVAFQSQDMQYECCVLKGVYYTQLNSTQPEITDAGV